MENKANENSQPGVAATKKMEDEKAKYAKETSMEAEVASIGKRKAHGKKGRKQGQWGQPPWMTGGWGVGLYPMMAMQHGPWGMPWSAMGPGMNPPVPPPHVMAKMMKRNRKAARKARQQNKKKAQTAEVEGVKEDKVETEEEIEDMQQSFDEIGLDEEGATDGVEDDEDDNENNEAEPEAEDSKEDEDDTDEEVEEDPPSPKSPRRQPPPKFRRMVAMQMLNPQFQNMMIRYLWQSMVRIQKEKEIQKEEGRTEGGDKAKEEGGDPVAGNEMQVPENTLRRMIKQLSKKWEKFNDKSGKAGSKVGGISRGGFGPMGHAFGPWTQPGSGPWAQFYQPQFGHGPAWGYGFPYDAY